MPSRREFERSHAERAEFLSHSHFIKYKRLTLIPLSFPPTMRNIPLPDKQLFGTDRLIYIPCQKIQYGEKDEKKKVYVCASDTRGVHALGACDNCHRTPAAEAPEAAAEEAVPAEEKSSRRIAAPKKPHHIGRTESLVGETFN